MDKQTGERIERLESQVEALQMKVKLLVSVLADVLRKDEPRFRPELLALDANDGAVA
jgi:hypothetical protein